MAEAVGVVSLTSESQQQFASQAPAVKSQTQVQSNSVHVLWVTEPRHPDKTITL